ncbi:MAG: YybH family protein [Gemmatimonadaceae bacterium]
MSDERAIRELVEKWASAVRAKDRAAILRHHSADILMFDVPPPLQSKGIDAYDKTWDLFYSGSPDPVAFEIREMNVSAGKDAAFVAALMRCETRMPNGGYGPLDFRLTIGLRKIDNQWTVMHEHHSVPAID